MTDTEQVPLEALRAEAAWQFRGNRNPRCPHCGDEYDVIENWTFRIYEEGEHALECPSCELIFTVQTAVSYSFNTDEQEDA
jgi:uncharacterized C2H2 Zn-finger protein